MKKTLLASIPLLVFIFILSSCGCSHEWMESTCEKARICTLCEETEGEPLGHQWQEATCTEAKTCSLCQKTEGNPLGHFWTEADCQSPKTCSNCFKTEGEPLEHKLGEWSFEEEFFVSSCINCGEEEKLSPEDYALSRLTGKWNALIMDYRGEHLNPGHSIEFHGDKTAALVLLENLDYPEKVIPVLEGYSRGEDFWSFNFYLEDIREPEYNRLPKEFGLYINFMLLDNPDEDFGDARVILLHSGYSAFWLMEKE